MSVSSKTGIPPLENGDRLTRQEFELRYTAASDIRKAELIEGVVYVASPVRASRHLQLDLTVCVGFLRLVEDLNQTQFASRDVLNQTLH